VFFQISCSAKEYLVAINMMLHKRVHRFVPEIDKTWDITYETLARLVVQKESVAAALTAVDFKIKMLSSGEWFTV
jgi:hypothetical protein